MTMNFPLRLKAIRVSQPLGDFYAISISARVLRQIIFLDPTRIESVDKQSFWYRLTGNQRPDSPSRTKSIGAYINTVESAFPNSIILAGNYDSFGNLIENESLRWRIESDECGESLVIPSGGKVASVVDGQHRLLGFDHCQDDRRDMSLLCSVYLDLPQAYQAYLFATININQRKVNKSLAYDQFGYNLDDETAESWSPDKLSVFLTRRLNLDPKSPLYSHIKIVPLDADLIFPILEEKSWMLSTASLVEGILGLISSKPNADRDLLHLKHLGERHRSLLPKDGSPFRELYRDGHDEKLWEIVLGYLELIQKYLWREASEKSFIRKTIGIQALFDVLRYIGLRTKSEELASVLEESIKKAVGINFADNFFQASGKGRVRVKNTILLKGGWIEPGELSDADRSNYLSIVAPDEIA
jgi:DNA phosphorothioation-associated DGQHR protein 1